MHMARICNMCKSWNINETAKVTLLLPVRKSSINRRNTVPDRLRWNDKYSAQCFSESPAAPRTVKQEGTDRPGGRVVRTVGLLSNVRLHLVDSVMRASPEVPLWTLSFLSKNGESKKNEKKLTRTVYVFHIDSARSYRCFESSGSFCQWVDVPYVFYPSCKSTNVSHR